MASGVACCDPLGDQKAEVPSKTITLKRSWGRRPWIISRMSTLETSMGKPIWLPLTSMMKTYSRGGRSLGITRLGGCAMSRKVFSSGA